MGLLFFSLKGEEGGDDGGEEAQCDLGGISLAFNDASPIWGATLWKVTFVIGDAFVSTVQGVGSHDSVGHALGVFTINVKFEGDVLAKITSVIDFAIGVEDV